MKRYFFVFLMVVFSSSFLYSAQKGDIKLGVYDNYSFTSEYADYTIYLKGWTKKKTLKSYQSENKISQVFSFKDKENAEYSIMNSPLALDIDSKELLNKILKKAQNEGRNAVLININGLDAFLYNVILEDKKTKKTSQKLHRKFATNSRAII